MEPTISGAIGDWLHHFDKLSTWEAVGRRLGYFALIFMAIFALKLLFEGVKAFFGDTSSPAPKKAAKADDPRS